MSLQGSTTRTYAWSVLVSVLLILSSLPLPVESATSVTGTIVSDTGHVAVEVQWDSFEVNPDTDAGFGEYVVFYRQGTSVDTGDNRVDSDSDASLANLAADTTILTGLSSNEQYTVAVAYEDSLGNLGPLSGSVSVTTRKRTLVINEFNSNPATEGTGEWVEVYNASSDTVNVDGYTLSSSSNTWTIPSRTWRLSPGQFMTLASDASEFKARYGYLPDFAATNTSSDTDVGPAFNFTNSSDTILLRTNTGELLDGVSWASNSSFDRVVTTDANDSPSVVRISRGGEGETVASEPERSEFTERLDLTFDGTDDGTFDSEGPDTGGAVLPPSIQLTDPIEGTDTTTSTIRVSGSSNYADAGDSVEVLVDGTIQRNTAIGGPGGWSVSGITLNGIGDIVTVRLYNNSTAGIVKDTDAVTLNFSDTNLLHTLNGDMEEDGPVSGPGLKTGQQPVDHWYLVNDNDDYLWDNAESYDGSASLALDDLETSYEAIASETVAISDTRDYRVSVRMKVSVNAPDKDVRMRIVWMDATGTVIDTDTRQTTLSSAGVWEREELLASAPSGAQQARLRVAGRESTNDNANLNLDNAEFAADTLPTLAIVHPPDGSDTYVKSFTVSGTTAATDTGDSVLVALNGSDTRTTTVDASGDWSLGGVTLQDDTNTIAASVYESDTTSRKYDTDSIALNYASVRVGVTRPEDQLDTSASTLTVGGTATVNADAGDSVEILVNGSVQGATAVESDSRWSFNQASLSGLDDSITARLYDRSTSGNVLDTDAVTVNFDDTNLLFSLNGDMEDNGPDTGPGLNAGQQPVEHWFVVNDNDDYLRDNAESYQGSASLALDDLEASYEEVVSGTVAVFDTGAYRAQAQFKVTANAPDKDLRLRIVWLDASGSSLDTDVRTTTLSASGVWLPQQVQGVAPSGAQQARFRVAAREDTDDNVNLNVDDAEFLAVTPSTIGLSRPSDGHDTTVQDITVSGTAALVSPGDSVSLTANGGGQAVTSVNGAGNWSVSDFSLGDSATRIVASIHVSNAASAIEDTRTVSVTYDGTGPVVPTLSAPADDTDTNQTSVRFDWTDSSDTISGLADYTIEVDTEASFDSPHWFNGDTTASDTVFNFTRNDTYHWRVIARDDVGNTSGYTPARSLRIDTAVPSIDSGPLTVTDSSDTLDFSRLDGDSNLTGGIDHVVVIKISGADTAHLYQTNDGSSPTVSDTRVSFSNTTADTWRAVIPDTNFSTGDTINFLVQASDRATNTTTEDRAGAGFEYLVRAPDTAGISIDTPPDNLYTRSQTGNVKGRSIDADEGDSVLLTVNRTDTRTTMIDAVGDWTVTNVTLNDIGDSIRVSLFESNTSSAREDTDSITLNYDNTAGTYPAGLTITDTGRDTVALQWNAFGSDPDTGAGFFSYIVFYDTQGAPDSGSTYRDAFADASIGGLSGDTTLLTDLRSDSTYYLRIGYYDRLGNLSGLSGTETAQTRAAPASVQFDRLQTPVSNNPAVADGSGTFPVRVIVRNSGGSAGSSTVDTGDVRIRSLDGTLVTSFDSRLLTPNRTVSANDTAVHLWSVTIPDTSVEERLGLFNLEYNGFGDRSQINVATPATRTTTPSGIDSWNATLGSVSLDGGATDGEPVFDTTIVSPSDRIIVSIQHGDTTDIDTPVVSPEYKFTSRHEFETTVNQADQQFIQGDTDIVSRGLFNIAIWKNDPGPDTNYVGDSDVLAENVQVRLPIPGNSGQNLAVAKLLPTTNRWKVIERTPRIVGNEVQLTVSSRQADVGAGFSVFRLVTVGVTGSGSASEVVVYPNPFIPFDGDPETGEYGSGTDQGIFFSAGADRGFPTGTKVEIYTVTGELITEKKLSGSGIIQWDARTRLDNPVRSGVYVFHIETPDGSTQVGKLSIVR